MKLLKNPAVVSALISTFFGGAILLFTHRHLEHFKQQLNDEAEIRVKQQKMYEELATSLEDMFGSSDNEYSQTLNKTFALLALYAPDDVYLACKESLIKNDTVYAEDVTPIVYAALRKSIFGDKTSLQSSDLVPHISAKHVPQELPE